MPELKVRCPNCGGEVGTGIAINDRESFETSDFRNNSTKCSNCGKTIVWDKEGVINADELE